MSVGRESLASDNHTCSREAEGSIRALWMFVRDVVSGCEWIYRFLRLEKRGGKEDRVLEFNSDPIGTLACRHLKGTQRTANPGQERDAQARDAFSRIFKCRNWTCRVKLSLGKRKDKSTFIPLNPSISLTGRSIYDERGQLNQIFQTSGAGFARLDVRSITDTIRRAPPADWIVGQNEFARLARNPETPGLLGLGNNWIMLASWSRPDHQ